MARWRSAANPAGRRSWCACRSRTAHRISKGSRHGDDRPCGEPWVTTKDAAPAARTQHALPAARPNLREIGDRKVRFMTAVLVAASMAGTVALAACTSAASSTAAKTGSSGTTGTSSTRSTKSNTTTASTRSAPPPAPRRPPRAAREARIIHPSNPGEWRPPRATASCPGAPASTSSHAAARRSLLCGHRRKVQQA